MSGDSKALTARMKRQFKRYVVVVGAVVLVMAPGILLREVFDTHGLRLDLCVLTSMLVTIPLFYKAITHLQRDAAREKDDGA